MDQAFPRIGRREPLDVPMRPPGEAPGEVRANYHDPRESFASWDTAFDMASDGVRLSVSSDVGSEGHPSSIRPAEVHTGGARYVIAGAAFGGALAFSFSLVSVLVYPDGRSTRTKIADVMVPTAIGTADGAAAASVAVAFEGAAARAAGGAAIAILSTGAFVVYDAIKLGLGKGTTVDMRRNFAANSSGAAAGLGGAWLGLEGGAFIGSFVGPVGTAIGGVIGGIGGGITAAFGGAIGGSKLDQAIWDQEEDMYQHSFESMWFSYERNAQPDPISPKLLEERYRKRLSENPDDKDWVSKCNHDLLCVIRRSHKTAYLEEAARAALQQLAVYASPGCVVSKHSGMVLDVKDRSHHDGAGIQQWSKTGADWQQFRFQKVGDGKHCVIVSKHTGKVLDVKDWSCDNGARVQQWSATHADWQLFFLEYEEDGTHFRIVSKHSGKALDVEGGSRDDGACICQWSQTGADWQLFRFEQVPP